MLMSHHRMPWQEISNQTHTMVNLIRLVQQQMKSKPREINQEIKEVPKHFFLMTIIYVNSKTRRSTSQKEMQTVQKQRDVFPLMTTQETGKV
jgi:hypothetical protein